MAKTELNKTLALLGELWRYTAPRGDWRVRGRIAAAFSALVAARGSNIITPLNAYLIIVLVFMRQVMPKAGMGTLIATMLPYTIVFGVVWTLLILGWIEMGWDLGKDGPLTYDPLR